MKNIVLATDLGGTNLRMSVVDSDGNVLYRTKRPTPDPDSVAAITKAIIDAADECRNEFRESPNILGIGIAVPATVDVIEGVILTAPNLPGLNGFAIEKYIESEVGLACLLENDANAAAVGENWLGASSGIRNSICVTLGTGVGGGIILNGELLRGPDGSAGEIGHVCVEPFGAKCKCGSSGCLEQYASASAIVRLGHEMLPQFPQSTLNSVPDFSAFDVYNAGVSGDELALEAFRLQGFYLGVALSGLINVLNPEVIVIGGGASAGWKLFSTSMKVIIGERAFPEPRKRVKILSAETGDDAGILGVAHLTFEKVTELT